MIDSTWKEHQLLLKLFQSKEWYGVSIRPLSVWIRFACPLARGQWSSTPIVFFRRDKDPKVQNAGTLTIFMAPLK